MRRRSLALLAAVAIGAPAVALTPGELLQPVAALALGPPLVLLLPGYALTAAIFPRRVLGAAERLTFSLGLSLALAVLGGFVLNLTPAGLRAGSWAALLGGVTAAALVASLRRRSAAGGTHPGIGLTRGQGAVLGLAALTVAGAVVVGVAGEAGSRTADLTQLWMLPAGDGAPDRVRLGIGSLESATRDYRLEVVLDGQVIYSSALTLEPGERWEAVAILPEATAGTATIEANLYRSDAPETVYRRVRSSPRR